jgi:hypothetical protein
MYHSLRSASPQTGRLALSLWLMVMGVLLPSGLPAETAGGFPTQSGLKAGAEARWLASGGRTSLRFDAGLLENLRLRISGSGSVRSPDQPGDHALAIAVFPELGFWAPRGAFDGFIGGALQQHGSLLLHYARDRDEGSVDLSDFTLVPASNETLELRDAAGQAWFYLDYIHVMLYPQSGMITLANMDLRINAALAERLGQPELEGIVIGQAFISAGMRPSSQPGLLDKSPDEPQDETLGSTACTAPNWHNGSNYTTDVALYNIGGVQQVAREPGVRVAIAPSASLRNVGTADVPWYGKFHTDPGETYPQPYSRDQHPFLVWALYREQDGIFEQVAASGLKHAFFAQNTACSCAGGNILWSANNATNVNGVGCTDLYSVSTNDDTARLGIRQEVPALTGAWEQCGSMFAPGATPPGPCAATFSGETADEFDRRLVVAESELGAPGASYWLDAWYLVRDDINIFNSMARVTLSPAYNGISMWNFSPGVTVSGPAIDAWVAPGTSTANSAHVRGNTGNGQYSLAVKVYDLGGGNRRFVYALMNFDFDAKFDRLALPLPVGVSVSDFGFADADTSAANDWVATVDAGQLAWTAPSGADLDWGLLATFYFETDAEPEQGVVLLSAGDSEDDFEVPVLALGPSDIILQDGFESPDFP